MDNESFFSLTSSPFFAHSPQSSTWATFSVAVGGGAGSRGSDGDADGSTGGGPGGEDLLIDYSNLDKEITKCLSNGTSASGGAPWPLVISGGGGWSASDIEFKLAIDVYLVSALCAIGFIGNAVTVAVLRSDVDGARNSTNWLLQTLAFVDTLYLATCVFIQPLKALYDTDSPGHRLLESIYPYIEPYVWPIASISQTLTVWTVLLVTIDRYVAVCRPLKRNLRSIGRTKLTAALGAVLAILYNLPLFFEREIAHPRPCSINARLVVPPVALTQKTALSKSIVYFIVYKTVCYFLFRSGGPLAVMIYVNIRLMRVLRVRRRRLTSRGCRHHHGGSVTAMLVGVVTIFVVCELPDVALRTTATMIVLYQLSGGASANWRTSSATDDFLVRANSVANALLAVNSSVNFIIYCLVGTKFREILVRRLRFVFGGGPCFYCCRRSLCCVPMVASSTLGGRLMMHDGTTTILPSTSTSRTGYFPVSGGLLDVYRSEYGIGMGNRSPVSGFLQPWSLPSSRAPFAPRSPTIDGGRPLSLTPWPLLLRPADRTLSFEMDGGCDAADTRSGLTDREKYECVIASGDSKRTDDVPDVGKETHHVTGHNDVVVRDGYDVIEVDICSGRLIGDGPADYL